MLNIWIRKRYAVSFEAWNVSELLLFNVRRSIFIPEHKKSNQKTQKKCCPASWTIKMFLFFRVAVSYNSSLYRELSHVILYIWQKGEVLCFYYVSLLLKLLLSDTHLLQHLTSTSRLLCHILFLPKILRHSKRNDHKISMYRFLFFYFLVPFFRFS